MSILTILALGRRLLWRHRHRVSHGLPHQVRPHHRHRPRLHALLAVSPLPYYLPHTLTIISRNTPITYFPHTAEGDSRFDFFKQIVVFHPMEKTLNKLDWAFEAPASQFALALFTFLYVDIIDATATLYSMVRFCGVMRDSDGDFPRSTIAYCTDAAFISISALFGSSPVTAFIESGAGIAEGGRTGLTAMVTGLCFIVSVFLAPIFASVPPWATGCTLILVGSLRLELVHTANSPRSAA